LGWDGRRKANGARHFVCHFATRSHRLAEAQQTKNGASPQMGERRRTRWPRMARPSLREDAAKLRCHVPIWISDPPARESRGQTDGSTHGESTSRDAAAYGDMNCDCVQGQFEFGGAQMVAVGHPQRGLLPIGHVLLFGLRYRSGSFSYCFTTARSPKLQQCRQHRQYHLYHQRRRCQ